MKKFLSFLAIALAATMLFSCEEKGGDEITSFATELSVLPATVEEVAASDVANITFEITANGTWSVTPSDKWITADPTTGAGNKSVVVSIADNIDEDGSVGAPREGSIIFNGDEGVKTEITIAQAGDANKLIQGLPFEGTFENGQGQFTIEDVKLTGELTYVWGASSYGSDFFMKASGYKGSAQEAESWLITPIVTLAGVEDAYLEFSHAGKYFGTPEEEGTVAVREAGSENWVGLDIPSHVTNADYTFINSGQISLKEFVGKNIQVGFCYKSSTAAAGTWEIRSVTIKEGSAVVVEPEAKLVTIDGITEPGLYKVENATVLATYARGFLAGDSTGKILVYKESEVVVGDVVTLEGQTSEYAGLPQFGGATEVTKTSTTTVERGEPVAMDAAALEAYVENPTIQYVTYTGVLTISEDGKYYNVAFEDTNKVQGSLSYPIQDLSAFDGKEIVVTGYTIGCSSNKFVNTMVVEVAEAVKVETNFSEETYKFLKAIVDGKLLGDATPVVEDWSAVTVEFPGITMQEIDGKLHVVKIWGAPFTSLPATIDLPELVQFSCNGNANLNGKTLPTTWNTPKVDYINMAWCQMTGNIPEGLASSTPKLVQLFMDNNQFSGAWPHTWAAGVNGGTGELEVVIANNGNTGMGYMIPATLDVSLNAWTTDWNGDGGTAHTNTQTEKVQLKVSEGNYIGFEKGWGQQRYVKYGNGSADDTATWHATRYLTSDTPGGWTVIPASIPTNMYDWDQAAADAFTADGTLPENPGADNSVTIAEIIEKGAGEYEVKDATVVAVTTKGILLNDGTGYIYNYMNKTPEYVVGDIVKIKGEVEIRYEMHQFKSSSTSEKTGHNDSFAQPTPEVIDAAKLDAYMSAPVYKYVEVTGVIEVGDFTNLIVEGTENTVSPSTYGDMAGLKALNGHSVTMKGYLAGSNTSSKYASIYIVEYTDNGVYVDPDAPVAPDFGSALKATISCAGGDGTNRESIVITEGDFTLNVLPGTHTTNPRWDSDCIRLYGTENVSNEMTVVAAKNDMVGVAITCTSTNYAAALGKAIVTVDSGATANVVVVGSIVYVAVEGTTKNVKLTGHTAQTRFSAIDVYYNEAAFTTNLGEKTYAFLKGIVDGNLMGSSTPVVDDWSNVDETFPGITLGDVNGKLEVIKIAGAPFTTLPAMDLPELVSVELRGSASLNETTMPTSWNTPKLEYFCIAACGMKGTFPAAFAANTPAMHTLFMDGNNFHGAWPHFWASGVNGGTGKLECVIANGGNSGMGYMVPATLDVKRNAYNPDGTHCNPSRDKTQIKLGGADANPAQYVGFEKGWGQDRYVAYGGGSASDTATWHATRDLAGNPDHWAYNFTNLPGTVPTVMLDWDQAAADAFTASGVLPTIPEEGGDEGDGGEHEGFGTSGTIALGDADFAALATACGSTLDASSLANVVATDDLTVNADGITYKGVEFLLGGGKFKFGTTSGANRVQLGGKGNTTKQVLIMTVPAAGTLKVTAISSGDAIRPLIVSVDGTEVASFDTPVKTETAAEFTVDCTTATKDSKVYIYSGESAINVISVEYAY